MPEASSAFFLSPVVLTVIKSSTSGRIEFKHVPAYGTAVRSAEYRVHMDDGYAIVGRDIADQRNNLDLLRDRDAVVHLLGKV